MMVRVSQRSMFNMHLSNMNSSLSELMDLNIQAGSQKKVNKPSDNSVAASRILNYRSNLNALDEYRENIATAQGWLKTQDQTLMQVNTVLTRVKELTEQAATGTMSQNNREQVGFEIRELYEQLIILGNTQYEGKHLFAGHKVDKPAFVQRLAITTNDPNVSNNYAIQGASEKTLLVQFLSNGSVGVDNLAYRYTNDGGRTWTTQTLAAGSATLNLNGVQVTMDIGGTVQAVNPNDPNETNNGSWLWVRPTAEYMGDDEDSLQVDKFGGPGIAGNATGAFANDVMVRIDNTSPVTLDQEIRYSYSLDKGVTWVEGNTALDSSSSTSASLVLPNGFLDLSTANPGDTLNPGEQFIIRPNRADIDFEISRGERITVNNVGKDVFGGIYTQPCASNASYVAVGNSAADNMFETVGKLIGFIETNNQSGIQTALDDLNQSSEKIMTAAASVGAKENRLDVADNVLSGLELNVGEQLSHLEDVDVAELMTELAQQQLVYESVLKSTSMIMRMSLANFI